MNIVLIGFKNSGKTSVGQMIAEKLQKTFIDTDRLIEKNYPNQGNKLLSTCEIYQHNGRDYFRALEKEVITSLDIHESIIATGGGSILDPSNVIHLKKLGRLIYLQSSFETLLARLQSRPIPAFLEAQRPEENFAEVYKARKNVYRHAADHTISTEHKSISDISEEIIALVEDL